jgi:rubrerythrin
MDDKLNEIIDFAVEREEEAIDFYQYVQSIAGFENQKDVLREFEQMEQGHIRILENLRQKEIADMETAEVPDLKISDYLVDVKQSEDMSYQDILITAMKKEEKAHNLYTKLSEDYKDPDVKKLFAQLASEEAKHKLHFETIYDEEILKED